MEYCPHCGAPLVEGTPVCGFCGTPVQQSPQQNQTSAWAPWQDAWQPQPQQNGSPSWEAAPTQPENRPEEPKPEPPAPKAPPVYEAPAAPAVPVTPLPVYATPPTQVIKQKKKRSALSVIASVLICCLLTVLVLPAFMLGSVQAGVSERSYVRILRSIDLEKLDAVEELCEEINDIGLEYNEWTELDPGDLQDILEQTQLPEFFAKQLYRLTQAILSEKKSFSIREKDVVAMLEDNLDILVDDFDLEIDEDALEEIAQEMLMATGLEKVDLDYDRQTREAISVVRTLLAPKTLIGALVPVVVLIVLLVLVNLSAPMCAVRDVGIVSIISGAVCVGMTLLPNLLLGLDDQGYLIGTALNALLWNGRLAAVLMLFGGIVLCVVSGLVRRKKR